MRVRLKGIEKLWMCPSCGFERVEKLRMLIDSLENTEMVLKAVEKLVVLG
jgi:hypothetical protein